MSAQKSLFSQFQDIAVQRSRQGKSYLEFLRVPSMSAGVYVLAADVEHRFYDIEEELTVLVFFAPAEVE